MADLLEILPRCVALTDLDVRLVGIFFCFSLVHFGFEEEEEEEEEEEGGKKEGEKKGMEQGRKGKKWTTLHSSCAH
jgi:hypothetical protein